MPILWFLHTLRGVLSTKLIPVHFPSNIVLDEQSQRDGNLFSSSTKRLYEKILGKRCRTCPV